MAERKAGAEQGVLQGVVADSHAPVVHLRAGATRGGEHLLPDRIVDQPRFQPVLVAETDGNGEVRNAVQEVGGAVQRIDDPLILVLAVLFAAFLGQNTVVGIGLAQNLDNLLFGLYVRFTDEVVALFGGDGQPFEVDRSDGAGCGWRSRRRAWRWSELDAWRADR
jgi:hypothetical protein